MFPPPVGSPPRDRRGTTVAVGVGAGVGAVDGVGFGLGCGGGEPGLSSSSLMRCASGSVGVVPPRHIAAAALSRLGLSESESESESAPRTPPNPTRYSRRWPPRLPRPSPASRRAARCCWSATSRRGSACVGQLGGGEGTGGELGLTRSGAAWVAARAGPHLVRPRAVAVAVAQVVGRRETDATA